MEQKGLEMTFKYRLQTLIISIRNSIPNSIQDEYLADEIINEFERIIDSVLEEQSKYHEDYAEGLHRLQSMLKK